MGGKAPALEAVLPIWDNLSKTIGLESSEAEAVGPVRKDPAVAGPSTNRALEKELMRMQQELWQEQDSGDESSVSEDEGRPGSSEDVRHLAPGDQQPEEKGKERKGEQQDRHELCNAADDDAEFGRRPTRQRPTAFDDVFHVDGSEKGEEPQISEGEKGSSRDPWWFVLRRKRRRFKERFGNEGHHHSTSNAASDHPTSPGLGPGIRERHGRRVGHHPWSKLDGQRDNRGASSEAFTDQQ